MSKLLSRGTAIAIGLLLPAMTLAQSDYYNDYNYDYYNDYDYTYDSGASTALGIGVIILLGIMFLVAVAVFIFEIVMIIDCVKRQFENRTVWLVVLIAGLFFGFGWIAAIIYYFTVKRKNIGVVHPTSTGTVPPSQPTQPMQK